MHMQPHSSSRTGRTLLCPPPPFVFPLAPPVIFIGYIFQDWRRRALDTLGPHTLLHCFLTLKADFLKALTQGAIMCLPPSLWGRIHYNSSSTTADFIFIHRVHPRSENQQCSPTASVHASPSPPQCKPPLRKKGSSASQIKQTFRAS